MQHKIEQTLTELIAIPSETHNQQGCLDIIEFVRSQLEPLGLYIKTELPRENPWLLATSQATQKPRVLLAAHLDTVPASNPEQLTARVEGHRLYGRGAWDMKFAAACYIELLKSKSSELAGYDIGVLFTTDEESGGPSVIDILKNGLRADVVILPDSSKGWTIEQRAKGLVQADLTAFGAHGHGSRPWESDNAIHKLLPALEELRKTYPSLKPQGPTLSITIFSGGKPGAINQVPDRAVAHLDIRAFEQEELFAAKTLLEKLARQHELRLHYYVDDQALVLDKDNFYVKNFVKTVLGQRGTALFTDAYGGTDGRHFAKYNIPCLIMSPDGNGFHQADEWVKRDDLEPYCQLIETYVFQSKLFSVNVAPNTSVAVLDENPKR